MKILNVICCSFLLLATCNAQVTWNAATTVATSGSGNDHPRVVLDRAGNPLILWGHSSRVMFARWDANAMAFTTPKMINPPSLQMASASWMGPDISAHGDTVYVVMKQVPEASDTCRLWCAHSYDGGKTFSTPVQVDTEAGIITRFPAVTTDADGNPVIAFMKFDLSFGSSRWAVMRSRDHGTTFTSDTKASGWSDSKSVVCDCCPGSITCSGSTVAMVYRDNDNNIRDSWAGISNDGGATFTRGWNVDNNRWNLDACPASGPGAVIVGDSLYSVFMNGASGTGLVYRSASPLDGSGPARTAALTGMTTGLTGQNYPRIAHSGSAAAIVWTQSVNGSSQLPLLFTEEITTGFPKQNQLIAMSNAVNADVAMHNGSIFVIWEDDNSGVIRFKSGTYPLTPTAVAERLPIASTTVYPNPVTDGDVQLHLPDASATAARVTVSNLLGQQLQIDDVAVEHGAARISLRAARAGTYLVRIVSGKQVYVTRVVRE